MFRRLIQYLQAIKEELLHDERNAGNPYHQGTYRRSGKLGYEYKPENYPPSMAYDEMEERGSERGFRDKA